MYVCMYIYMCMYGWMYGCIYEIINFGSMYDLFWCGCCWGGGGLKLYLCGQIIYLYVHICFNLLLFLYFPKRIIYHSRLFHIYIDTSDIWVVVCLFFDFLRSSKNVCCLGRWGGAGADSRAERIFFGWVDR